MEVPLTLADGAELFFESGDEFGFDGVTVGAEVR